jgi:hypothetical protein
MITVKSWGEHLHVAADLLWNNQESQEALMTSHPLYFHNFLNIYFRYIPYVIVVKYFNIIIINHFTTKLYKNFSLFGINKRVLCAEIKKQEVLKDKYSLCPFSIQASAGSDRDRPSTD